MNVSKKYRSVKKNCQDYTLMYLLEHEVQFLNSNSKHGSYSQSICNILNNLTQIKWGENLLNQHEIILNMRILKKNSQHNDKIKSILVDPRLSRRQFFSQRFLLCSPLYSDLHLGRIGNLWTWSAGDK